MFPAFASFSTLTYLAPVKGATSCALLSYNAPSQDEISPEASNELEGIKIFSKEKKEF